MPADLRVPPDDLERFVALTLGAMGADAEVAACVAAHLVRSNLSGHDSHGVLRLPQYVAQAAAGEIHPAARPCLLRDQGAVSVVDARRSFGHFSTMFAMDWALERARTTGLAAAAVRHSTHVGRLGEYTERASDRGMAAMVTAGAAGPGVGGMVLYGGTRRFLAANPWSVGIPVQDAPPVVFDASTSMIAEGKVRVARARGEELPPECIIDAAGSVSRVAADFYAGGALLPLGGTVAGHKGYGFALAAALLGGLAMIDDPDPTMIGVSVREQSDEPGGKVAGVFVLAIDPAFFGDAAGYGAIARGLIDAIRRVPPAPGAEVLVPGEIERRTRDLRTREGIPLPAATVEELLRVADRFNVPPPAAMKE